MNMIMNNDDMRKLRELLNDPRVVCKFRINGQDVDLAKFFNLPPTQVTNETAKIEIPTPLVEEQKYATTFGEPKVIKQPNMSYLEPTPMDDLVETIDDDNDMFITDDIHKEDDSEIYYLTPYIKYNGKFIRTSDSPREIEFASVYDGDPSVGITDEQLIALLLYRFRNDEKRAQILIDLAKTYYGN